MKVALGAARGLAFLHNAETMVIYRDFKTSNILLDSVCKIYFHEALLVLIFELIFGFLTLNTINRTLMRNYLILDWREMGPLVIKVMFLLGLWEPMDMLLLNIYPQVFLLNLTADTINLTSYER